MSLPFGLPTIVEIGVKKKGGSAESTALYEQKLEKYRDMLENYKKCLVDYSGKLDGYEGRTVDNQLSIVQTALDLTYMKEQSDNIMEALSKSKEDPENKAQTQLEGLTAAMIDVNYKLDGLDKNVVNRLSDFLTELQKQSVFQNKQLQTELFTSIEGLTKSVKRGHGLLWFLMIFNLISLSGIAFLVLYILEIIPF